VNRFAPDQVAGIVQPLASPRLIPILMSNVREATPEVIGRVGVFIMMLPVSG
jgi:hypothetical protein